MDTRPKVVCNCAGQYPACAGCGWARPITSPLPLLGANKAYPVRHSNRCRCAAAESGVNLEIRLMEVTDASRS